MRVYLVYLISGAGALVSCSATKFKSARSLSASREASAYMDSSFRESRLAEFSGQSREIYDGIWWLKGNVHISLDSGVRADEARISYREINTVRQQFRDSTQQSVRQKAMEQQESHQSLAEKQKAKESITKLPWWVYILLLGLGVFVLFRRVR